MNCDPIDFAALVDHPDPQVSAHLVDCPQCQGTFVEYARQTSQLAGLALTPGPGFDQQVLARLEQRGFFEPRQPDTLSLIFGWMGRGLKLATALACLVLFLWMASLLGAHPAPEMRALGPGPARHWASLPEAVPPPAFPQSPDRRLLEMVEDQQAAPQ